MGSNRIHPPAAAWAPVFLRLGVGLTLLWAGLGKWYGVATFESAQRRLLTEMGALKPDAPATPSVPDNAPAATAGASDQPIELRRVWGLALKVHKAGHPTEPAEVGAPRNPEPAPNKPDAAPAAEPNHESNNPPPTGAENPTPNGAEPGSTAAAPPSPDSSTQGPPSQAAPTAPPASSPGPGAIWPSWLTTPRLSAIQAWCVMGVEVIAGACVLLGLFTRLSAALLACVMLGAIWLDQLGPAWQTGRTILGFLPDYPTFDTRLWMPLFWQFGLLCSCLALMLMGGGRMKADRFLPGSRAHDDSDEL